VSNKSQTDTDKDTRGDVCDNCVSVSNPPGEHGRRPVRQRL